MLRKWYSSYTGVTHLVFVLHLNHWQSLTAVKHFKLLHSLEIVPMSKTVLPKLFKLFIYMDNEIYDSNMLTLSQTSAYILV